MNEQAMVDRFAELAKPRLFELLRLNIEHVYDPAPGDATSTFGRDSGDVRLKLMRTVQPYGDIERFVAQDKVMGYVVNPGLLPIAKAISSDVRGRRLLVTRKIADKVGDKGVVAHTDGIGVRIMMYFDSDQNETHLVWECLYGVA